MMTFRGAIDLDKALTTLTGGFFVSLIVWYALVRPCANETHACIGLVRWYVPTINKKEYYYYYIIDVPIYMCPKKRTKRTKVPETHAHIGFGWHKQCTNDVPTCTKLGTLLQFRVKSARWLCEK
jgi:hypothetical protein